MATDTNTTTTPPKWSSHAAKSIVKNIDNSVDLMIGETKFAGPDWAHKNDFFGCFDRDELILGTLLGSGGFSDVYELKAITLKNGKASKYTRAQIAARKYYSQNTQRNGVSKYAVKMLRVKTTRTDNNFCMAAADLTAEAHLLASLNHRHILNIRGWSYGGTKSLESGSYDSYFLILDRLHCTLDKKIEQWRQQSIEVLPSFRSLKTKNTKNDALVERTKIAYQLGSALNYLHSRGIVFRDLKPANIGLDEDGNVQLFDFGLSREIPDPEAGDDERFEMSGGVGTVRYMAPESSLGYRYNCKVDVYSWSMVFWEMLALEKPYDQYTRNMHREYVCVDGRRPINNHLWPSRVQRILEKAWYQNVYVRLTMDEIVAEMKDLTMALDSRTQLEARARRRSTFQVPMPVRISEAAKDEQDTAMSSAPTASSILNTITSMTLTSKAA